MLTSLLRARRVLTRVARFSTSSSSSLFQKRLKELRQSIKDTETASKNQAAAREGTSKDAHSMSQNYYSDLNTERPTSSAGQAPDLMRPELIYSMELEDVLGALRRVREDKTLPRQSHDFYNACLERINSLVIERGSKVGKNELVSILRELSYYRPKEDDEKERMRKSQGLYTKSEAQDDLLSVRHKRLIEEKSNRFRTVPGDMANFIFQNLSKGLFKDMFT
jgi:hypothetical protein